MTCNVILEVTAAAGKAEELLSTFGAILGDTRGYEGCQGVEVVVNQDDPANMVLLERWDSRAHYEKYLGWRQERGDLDALGQMLAGPPSIRYFDTAAV